MPDGNNQTANPTEFFKAAEQQVLACIVSLAQHYMAATPADRDGYINGLKVAARIGMSVCLGVGPIMAPNADSKAIYDRIYRTYLDAIVPLVKKANLDPHNAETFIGAIQRGFEEAKLQALGPPSSMQ